MATGPGNPLSRETGFVARPKRQWQNHAIAIMLNNPAARDFHDLDFIDYKDRLNELVPAWPELNDTCSGSALRQRGSNLQTMGNG